MEEKMEERDIIVDTLIQTGMLAYVPDMESRTLKPIGEYAEIWGEKIPAMDARTIKDSWVKDRYGWDYTMEANWEAQSDWKEIKEGIQAYKNDYLDDRSVLITVDEEEIFTGSSAELQSHPAMREAKHREILSKLPDALLKNKQAAPGKDSKDMKKRKRVRAAIASRKVSKEYQEKVAVYLHEGASTEDLLKQVIPAAKKKGGRQKPCAMKKKIKDHQKVLLSLKK